MVIVDLFANNRSQQIVKDCQIDICSYDRCGKTWLDTSSNQGTSKRTCPLWLFQDKMDTPIALFPANLCSITNKQVILFVDMH